MPLTDSAGAGEAVARTAPDVSANGQTDARPAFTVFLSGVIQGSHADDTLHAQNYRQELRDIITAAHPEAEVVCPVELNPESVAYDNEAARRAFMSELDLAAKADVLVAYAPVATMGTAVEMYRAHAAGRLVFTISPMATNWTVRFLSAQVFEDLPAFEAFVRNGGLGRAVAVHLAVA